MKVNTEKLKEMVSKAVQGASNNKMVPITQLMGIVKTQDSLILTTTDATNYLYITGNVDKKEEDINVAVPVEQFSKLISKMTCKEVYLSVKDNVLEVKGNGTYEIELSLDENTGELIVYPNPRGEYFDGDFEYTGKISAEDVKVVLDTIKPSLATTLELPAITNYYIGDKVCATDRFKIASFDVGMFKEECLVSSQLMDLIGVIAQENISYFINGEVMLFETKVGSVFCKNVESTEEYPIQAINNFVDQDFKSVCKVNKNDFIALLERIALFVGKYDDKAIRLYFEADGIRVSNKSRKSNELIEYSDSKDYEQYDCTIDIDMLLTQLRAYNSDVVEIHYNNEACIKFVDNDIIQIVALMEEPN